MMNQNQNQAVQATVTCLNDHLSNEFKVYDVERWSERVNYLQLTDKPLPASFKELKLRGCQNCLATGGWEVIEIK